jgi:glycerate dehydrogenase
MMNIVVLDGYTLNPGDLSWAGLESLGPCTVYERTAQGSLTPRAGSAEILLTNKTALTRDHFQNLPTVKYIGVLATGTDIVDLAAARERRITVTNVPAYGTRSVAQTTIALLLELTQHVGHHAQSVRQGRWTQNPDWSYWERPLVELDGLTMGIVGFGRIGSAVGQLAAALGMKVVACSATTKPLPAFATRTEVETLLRQSDVVSLHCPLTPQTRKLISAEKLAQMKPSAFLLNTSRGLLVDEPALANALNAGKLAGAGLDVLSVEPPPADHPLLHAKNCLLTPHLAWATRAARGRLMAIATENVRCFLNGTPQNVVS